MKVKINFILGVLLIVYFDICNAQTIRGKITDEKKSPIEFINVVALSSNDSSFVAGCTTDKNGDYMIQLHEPFSCILRASGVGYRTCYKLINIKDNAINNITLLQEAHLLKGITVSSSNTTQRIDRKEIVPLKMQIYASSNGLDLLNRMKLPGVLVDALAQSVSSVSGMGSIQLRINDVLATVKDILALPLACIVRVEEIDMPGIRYGSGISQVINFIVVRPTSGESGGIGLMNSVNADYGKDNAWIKYNKGKSELGLQYSCDYTGYKRWETNSTQFLMMKNNAMLNINRNGRCKDYKEYVHDAALKYNWTNPDKTTFNIELSTDWNHKPLYKSFESVVESGFHNDSTESETKVKDNTFTPELDIYFEQQLKHGQTLSATLIGTYVKSNYLRSYEIPDYLSAYTVKGDKYSIYGEVDYEKVFKNGNDFSAGYQQTQSYTDNHYLGSTGDVYTAMHDNSEELYAQYDGKIHRFGYVIGIGGKRQHFNEGSNGFTYYYFQPNIVLNYSLSKAITLTYQFGQNYGMPSLSDLSNVIQWQNNYEAVRGNPNLHPGHSNVNILAFQYIKNSLTIYSNIYYQYNHHYINDDAVQRISEGDSIYFLHTKSNNSNYQHLQGRLFVRNGFLNDKLYLSFLVGINRHIVTSSEYCHTHTSLFGNMSADAYLGKWQLSASYDMGYSGLFSEVVNRTYQSANVSVGYKWKQMIMHIGVSDPLIKNGNYTREETLSTIAYKKAYTRIKDMGNMVFVSLSWNFSTGRKHNAGEVEKKYIDKSSGIVK
jgi:hypothetical protein